MQRESESEESVLWNEIGEVLDTEMSTVEDIRADLARNDKGNTCQTINNCMLVFQRDPVLKGAIRKNELSGKIDIVGNLGWQRTSSSLTDTDVYQIHWYLEKNYGLKNDRNINNASEIKTLFAKADEQVHVDEIRKQKTYYAIIEEMEKQRTPMMSTKNILLHQFWYMDKLFFGKMAELGESCYFNTKQCVAAWLVLSGMINVMILFLIAGYLNYHWSVGLLQVGLYILTPYLVSSITALGILSMETRGKNSSLFGMSAILLSISYGVIGSIPRALFVTTLWIWAVAFLVSGLLFVIQIKKLLSKMEKGEVLCTN